MANKVSYICPRCGETLTFDECYVDLVGNIDLVCPVCKQTFKGHELKKPESVVVLKPQVSDRRPADKQQRKPQFEVVRLIIVENYIDEAGTPGGKGDSYEISTAKTVIGRRSASSKADVQIPSNRYMSRQHAAITKEKEGYRIRWVGSTNPLLVNGKAVTDESGIELKDGDKITMGQCVAKWECRLIDKDRSIMF